MNILRDYRYRPHDSARQMTGVECDGSFGWSTCGRCHGCSLWVVYIL
jgi:hypothetical protein